ncbi:MAG: hypothetical protein KY476_04410 [Planctomycetes bacterium]|nr:hypothetical protein [Planctomycetota bacterium]
MVVLRRTREDLLGAFDLSFMLTVAALLGVLAVAVWLVVWIRARYCGGEDPAAQVHEMLTQMAQTHREGGLSDEEYRSIKGQLVERLDGSPRRAFETPPAVVGESEAARSEQSH